MLDGLYIKSYKLKEICKEAFYMLNKFAKANWFFYIVLVLFTFCDIYIIHSLSHHYTLQLYSNDGLKKHSIEELRLKIVNFLAPKFGQTLD